MKKNRVFSQYTKSKESSSMLENEYILHVTLIPPEQSLEHPHGCTLLLLLQFLPSGYFCVSLTQEVHLKCPIPARLSGVSQNKQQPSVWTKSPLPITAMEIILKVNKCTGNYCPTQSPAAITHSYTLNRCRESQLIAVI